MQSSFSVAIPSRDILGESPWWCNKEQALWREDILSNSAFNWYYSTNSQNKWRLNDKVGFFKNLAQGHRSSSIIWQGTPTASGGKSNGTLRALKGGSDEQPIQ